MPRLCRKPVRLSKNLDEQSYERSFLALFDTLNARKLHAPPYINPRRNA